MTERRPVTTLNINNFCASTNNDDYSVRPVSQQKPYLEALSLMIRRRKLNLNID